jgi:hypothetical protein
MEIILLIIDDRVYLTKCSNFSNPSELLKDMSLSSSEGLEKLAHFVR